MTGKAITRPIKFRVWDKVTSSYCKALEEVIDDEQ